MSNLSKTCRVGIALGLMVCTVVAVVTWVCMSHRQRRQLRQLRLPQTTQRFQPHQLQWINTDPVIQLYHDFLTEKECRHLIQLAQSKLAESTVVSSTNQYTKSLDRTSKSATLYASTDPLVVEIMNRASLFMHVPPSHIEPLQVVRYRPGEYFRPHYDFFDMKTDSGKKLASGGGQRVMTMFVYLNSMPTEEKSSCTVFPKLSLSIKPKQGAALFFRNTDLLGHEDYQTLHGGESPTTGIKFGLNIWARAHPYS